MNPIKSEVLILDLDLANPLPLINTRHGSTINEEDEKYSDDFSSSKYSFDRDGIQLYSNKSKMIVYSRKKENINDRVVYTISNKNERPPKIDDLFALKVKVPKIQVSKYFEDKYTDKDIRYALKTI